MDAELTSTDDSRKHGFIHSLPIKNPPSLEKTCVVIPSSTLIARCFWLDVFFERFLMVG